MNNKEFLDTIYYGDRWCKKIIINSELDQIKIQIDLISRIRSKSGQWDFYTDEDITDGYLVFDKVSFFEFKPAGLIPNDAINMIELVETDNDNLTSKFELNISSAKGVGNYKEVKLSIIAGELSLEDPLKPNEFIKD